MPVDASIPLGIQPPPNNTLNTLMGYFQIQNAMRQQQLGQIQVQQAMQQQVQRNNLLEAIQSHPEWIDNDTGLLNTSGQAEVMRRDPYSGSSLLKDMQDAAKAQAETRTSIANTSKTNFELAMQQHAAVASAFGALGQNPTDQNIDMVAASLQDHVPPQLLQQAVAQLKGVQDPTQRRLLVQSMAAQQQQSMKALQDAYDQQYKESHGGLSQENVTSQRNVNVQQAGETQREREVQTAETGRTMLGLNPQLQAEKAQATEAAKKGADIQQALSMRGQWAKNLVNQIDQALTVVDNPKIQPRTSGAGQQLTSAQNYIGVSSPANTATNELNSNLAKLSQLGTNDPLAKLKGMTTKAQLDLEAAAQGKNWQSLDSLKQILTRNRAYYNAIASGHDPDSLSSMAGLSPPGGGGGIDLDAVSAELARRKSSK